MLNFNVGRAKQQARELENIGHRLKSFSTDTYMQTVEKTASAWTGENAEAYIRKAVRLQEKMNQTAKQIEQTSSAMYRSIQAAVRAEEEARRLAQEREYK